MKDGLRLPLLRALLHCTGTGRWRWELIATDTGTPCGSWFRKGHPNLLGFLRAAPCFQPKCTLGRMNSLYMVLVASEQKLLMMRPCQIYAVKNIVKCIDESSGNGYVWHTSGSANTVTRFKASTLLKANPDIEKCLFVVERKDLDRQTREEFNCFQEGCVEQNTNTGELVRRLLRDETADKVIVCTIEKLGLVLNENSKRNRCRERRGIDAVSVSLASVFKIEPEGRSGGCTGPQQKRCTFSSIGDSKTSRAAKDRRLPDFAGRADCRTGTEGRSHEDLQARPVAAALSARRRNPFLALQDGNCHLGLECGRVVTAEFSHFSLLLSAGNSRRPLKQIYHLTR